MRLLALLAAVTAAALVPETPHGVHTVVVVALVGATAVAATGVSLERLFLGGLALALASMAAILDALWVVAVDLLAAWLLATIAVAGRQLTAPLTPLLALRELPSQMPSPSPQSLPALRGATLGGVLVVPFTALFWTADAAFAELGRTVPFPSAASLPGRVLTFAVVLAAALGLALATSRAQQLRLFASTRRLEPAEWAIPLALLNLLFMTFVAIQFAVLFGGRDHVLRTAGLTYSEYARQGFWQLIVVAVLTLAVLAAAVRVGATRERGHVLLLRGLLGSLCLLAIVIVASALHRLGLYEQAFGLTRHRLAAETVAWGLGALFALLTVAAVVGPVRRTLDVIVLVGTAAGLLAFSLSNPEGRIAERNVARWHDTGRLDLDYARRLSADAAPALARLPPPLRTQALASLASRLAEPEPWYAANLSRRRARDLLAR